MDKYALITGASMGIGREMALYLGSKGYSLILTARNKQALEKLSSEIISRFRIQCSIIPADLSEPESYNKIYNYCKINNIVPYVLINNAGFGNGGFFGENDLKRELDLIQVNIASLTALTRLFIPDMIKAGGGYIQNVGSVAGFIPGPYMSSYYASKAYVLSFTEGLREELLPHRIYMSVLCPGPTKTEFFKNAGVNNTRIAAGKLAGMMSAESVARTGIDGMFSGKTVIIPGLMNKALPFLVRITPRILMRKISSSFNKGRTQ